MENYGEQCQIKTCQISLLTIILSVPNWNPPTSTNAVVDTEPTFTKLFYVSGNHYLMSVAWVDYTAKRETGFSKNIMPWKSSV